MAPIFGERVPLLHCSGGTSMLVVNIKAAHVEFVRNANSRLGVAPSTEDISRKLEANMLQIPVALRPVSKGTAAEVKARMWAKRWRERWGARYGKLRLREDIPVEEMQQKVSLFRGGWVSFWVAAGCGKRTCFWCRIPAPKTGPVSGPLIRIL